MATVDTAVRKLGADLLNTQLWCWGADILSPYGNLLVEFGCRREPPQQGNSAPSLYRWEQPGAGRIILRGFGAFIGDDRLGGVFLRRDGFQPQFTPAADLDRPAWHATDLPRLSRPRATEIERMTRLVVAFIDWTLKYEQWIPQAAADDWRERSLQPWHGNHPRCRYRSELTGGWTEFRERLLEEPDGILCSGRIRR